MFSALSFDQDFHPEPAFRYRSEEVRRKKIPMEFFIRGDRIHQSPLLPTYLHPTYMSQNGRGEQMLALELESWFKYHP